jgi:hypothetical protein
LPSTKNLAQEYAKHIGIPDNEFDDWFENTFKKYESGTPNFEAHHVIPVNVLETNKELQDLLFELKQANPDFDLDFFNKVDNGIMVQKRSVVFDINGHTVHKKYNDAIEIKITEIIQKTPSQEKAFDEIKALIENTKETLRKEVLLGNKNVNDIVNF